MEAGAVIGRLTCPAIPRRDTLTVLYWHTPSGRTSGSLPDDRTLWDVLWQTHQAGTLVGFAHTHPGHGTPAPSPLDLETFTAIERALGRPLLWWILSADRAIRVTIDQASPRDLNWHAWRLMTETLPWADELRARSWPIPDAESTTRSITNDRR